MHTDEGLSGSAQAQRGASVTSLARLRLPMDEAEAALRRLDAFTNGEPDADVLTSLIASAHPRAALRALERLAERGAYRDVRARPTMLQRFTVLAGVSDALADLMVGDPTLIDGLVNGLEPQDAQAVRHTLTADLSSAEDVQAAANGLARGQRRGLLRIATRDLLGYADTPTAAHELADLAAGVLRGGLDYVTAGTTEARLSVIAMGKLGGTELNYVSDIDVMFVYDGDREVASVWAGRLMQVLSLMTPLGQTYDVDANLRPEGRDGPLVRTVHGYRSYYARWAQTWEQQALLKARPVAGDHDLGEEFMELIDPFVWPDRRTGDTVEAIQKMKGVVEASAPVRRAGDREVKLAPGGLRDIEFAVQLLQLVHGRHDQTLRSPNTLTALRALADGAYVDDGDANLFSDAYQFLRTVEHRLQLRNLRRTHVIPDRDDDRYRLARSCGFRDLTNASALQQFDRELLRVRGAVRRLHEKLFYRPLLQRFAEVSRDETRAVGGGGLGFDDDAAAQRLAALGFASPRRSIAHLKALSTGSSRAAQLLRTALPTLLPTMAQGPDPDAGLLALRTLTERLADSPSYLSVLRDAPPVGQILATVLPRSKLVGEWLERQPEVFKTLADPAALQTQLAPQDYQKVALGLIRRGGGEGEVSAALRRFKRREIARIAVRDLTGRTDPIGVAQELTGLAGACLDATVRLVTDNYDCRLAVIGLGKLGAAELGYASDLDIIVLFDPPGARTSALAGVEQLVRMLSSITPEGQAFAVDLKLRPEGKDGPMARTLDSTVQYYKRWAAPWELFALTQARVVAGDRELGQAMITGIREKVWPKSVDAAYLREIRGMKARLERERAHTASTDALDIKLGPGGLSDIEWTLQLLAVRHALHHRELRQPGVGPVGLAATGCGILSGEEGVWLRQAWLLLTRLRNARYLAGARLTDRVPTDSSSLERLATMLAYDSPGAQNLAEDLTRAMRRVRRVHERHFYGDA